MKTKLKIITLILLLIFQINVALGLEGKISVNNNKIDINDYVELNVKVNSDSNSNVGISDIKGISNFEIVNKSQYQSVSSSIVTINGKRQSKNKITSNLVLQLKAKEKGNYIIGPAIIESGTGKIETNKIEVEITGDKLFLNNNHLNIPKNNPPSQHSPLQEEGVKKATDSGLELDTFEQTDKKIFDSKKELYILIIVLLVLSVLFYIILKYKKKEEENKTPNPLSGALEKVERLIYPKIDDQLFAEKIDKAFRIKIYRKYKIDDVKTMGYYEILEKIKVETSIYRVGDKENEDKIINLLNNLIYGDIEIDRKELLALIKSL